jgi:hypothetical protein
MLYKRRSRNWDTFTLIRSRRLRSFSTPTAFITSVAPALGLTPSRFSCRRLKPALDCLSERTQHSAPLRGTSCWLRYAALARLAFCVETRSRSHPFANRRRKDGAPTLFSIQTKRPTRSGQASSKRSLSGAPGENEGHSRSRSRNRQPQDSVG